MRAYSVFEEFHYCAGHCGLIYIPKVWNESSWNTLNSAVIGDAAGEGVDLLYLSGVSNPRRTATLVVLDPATMGGASVEDAPQDQLVGFAAGRERARVFFSRSNVNWACGGPYNHGPQVTLSHGLIGVEIDEGCGHGVASLHYALRPTDYAVFQVGFADSFKALYERLRAEGKSTMRSLTLWKPNASRKRE